MYRRRKRDPTVDGIDYLELTAPFTDPLKMKNII